MNTFTHVFWVVWNRQHYRLACLLDHLKHKVPAGQARLISYPNYNVVTVPISEVRFQDSYPTTEFPVRKELRVRLKS